MSAASADLDPRQQAALEIVARRQREHGAGVSRVSLVNTLYARFEISRAEAGAIVAALLRATLLREYAAGKGTLLGVEPRDVAPRRHAPVRGYDISAASEDLTFPAESFESEVG